ncbi:MAG: T9SS type A sorting domain-containing protein [Lewinellaceae bacterium]|nr:T9SS type A sorting domain-containing protein [Lewinellaceae bacterium]
MERRYALDDQNYLYNMSHPSQTLNPAYGYLWWLNGQSSYGCQDFNSTPGKLIPNAPDDMFAALGKNDQKIHIVPSKGWVIVRQGNDAGLPGLAGLVPIAFDNLLWGYLNNLQCGSVSTSEVEDASLRVWPNPSADVWMVDYPGLVSGWVLYDAQGRQVRAAEGLSEMPFRVDGAGLEPGVYWLKVVAGEGVMWRRVVKDKVVIGTLVYRKFNGIITEE